MRKYYIEENKKQVGPFSIEVLLTKNIKKSTLVWTDGLDSWVEASTISELELVIVSEPPPLPSSSPMAKPKSRYDETYEKETWATTTGIILLIGGVILSNQIPRNALVNETRIYYAAIILVIRIIVLVEVVKISGRQLRNSTAWGFFAFILPSLALLIIGLLPKLKRTFKYKPMQIP